MKDILIRLKNVTKKYSGVPVLKDVSLDLYKGEIHAICGENGAGKSTLIKVLTGAIVPTSGTIVIEEKEYIGFLPREAMENGIAVVYQEFSLIPYLTVSENIFFGREIKRYGIVDKNKMNNIALELCRNLGIELDINKKIYELGIAYQQIVEILKAVSLNSRIIILDEPTAPLTVKETELFFELVRKLKEKGTTIIFISHRLEEVFEICDRVTVLCDGNKILTASINDIDRRKLISAMVGRDLSEDYPKSESKINDEVVLKVDNISNAKVHNVSFELKRGEILGFGGLVGAGRTELMRIIFGVDGYVSGKMYRNNKTYHPKSPKEALSLGIGLIPEDRKNQGIIACRSVANNICLSSEHRLSNFHIIDKKKEDSIAEEYIQSMRIKVLSKFQLIRNLSGGNQQKAVVSKILATNCDIIIFDEPTRGIDVGAKYEIYNIMVELVKLGKSIIMVSSEMPELMGMSDRILVMSCGKIKGELLRESFSQEKILEIASYS